MMYAVLFALIGRAFVLVRARAAFYAAATLLTIVAEAVALFLMPNERGILICSGLLQSILAAIVYARLAADNAMVHEKTSEAPFDVTGRVLERLWAVIIIDFALAFAGDAFTRWGAPYGDAGAAASEIGLLVFNILFLFADVSATVDERTNLFLLVPRSIWKSVRFLFSRMAPFVFLVLALQYLLLSGITLLTYFADGGAQTPVAFWLSLALGTLTIPPLGALATLVYVEVPRLREKG